MKLKHTLIFLAGIVAGIFLTGFVKGLYSGLTKP
jgi:hypothetical protein